jgi:hypothetical protein
MGAEIFGAAYSLAKLMKMLSARADFWILAENIIAA